MNSVPNEPVADEATAAYVVDEAGNVIATVNVPPLEPEYHKPASRPRMRSLFSFMSSMPSLGGVLQEPPTSRYRSKHARGRGSRLNRNRPNFTTRLAGLATEIRTNRENKEIKAQSIRRADHERVKNLSAIARLKAVATMSPVDFSHPSPPKAVTKETHALAVMASHSRKLADAPKQRLRAVRAKKFARWNRITELRKERERVQAEREAMRVAG